MDTQSSNDALRILIVDADPHDAALAALVLTHGLPQARIEEVSSAPRFTQVLAGGRYDIVVVDPTVPWADAGGVLQTLQTCQPDTAVVVLTRTGDAGSAVEALRAGASDYLIKGSESWLRLPIAVRAARYRGRPAAREIEQLRRQVAALEAANRGLAEFPLTAAHELDAPLRLVDRQLAELPRGRGARRGGPAGAGLRRRRHPAPAGSRRHPAHVCSPRRGSAGAHRLRLQRARRAGHRAGPRRPGHRRYHDPARPPPDREGRCRAAAAAVPQLTG